MGPPPTRRVSPPRNIFPACSTGTSLGYFSMSALDRAGRGRQGRRRYSAKSVQHAREAGDRLEAVLIQRGSRLQRPMEVRRIDVFSDTLADIAARTAREADTFVAVRPNGAAQEPEDMIEGVLFGSGRHLLLVPDRKPARMAFDHILVAWNGSRGSTRSLAESMPYLDKAKSVA